MLVTNHTPYLFKTISIKYVHRKLQLRAKLLPYPVHTTKLQQRYYKVTKTQDA